jgi:hypothetical protein
MPQVGELYRLKKDCLGNKAGTIGMVYEIYQDFDFPDKMATSVIFQNGSFDGFSVTDMGIFLDYCGFSEPGSQYVFKNVVQLTNDFRNGKFRGIIPGFK